MPLSVVEKDGDSSIMDGDDIDPTVSVEVTLGMDVVESIEHVHAILELERVVDSVLITVLSPDTDRRRECDRSGYDALRDACTEMYESLLSCTLAPKTSPRRALRLRTRRFRSKEGSRRAQPSCERKASSSAGSIDTESSLAGKDPPIASSRNAVIARTRSACISARSLRRFA